jgi:transposase
MKRGRPRALTPERESEFAKVCPFDRRVPVAERLEMQRKFGISESTFWRLREQLRASDLKQNTGDKP